MRVFGEPVAVMVRGLPPHEPACVGASLAPVGGSFDVWVAALGVAVANVSDRRTGERLVAVLNEVPVACLEDAEDLRGMAQGLLAMFRLQDRLERIAALKAQGLV